MFEPKTGKKSMQRMHRKVCRNVTASRIGEEEIPGWSSMIIERNSVPGEIQKEPVLTAKVLRELFGEQSADSTESRVAVYEAFSVEVVNGTKRRCYRGNVGCS